jgi:hypothetical protein
LHPKSLNPPTVPSFLGWQAVLVDTDRCRAFETADLSTLKVGEGDGAKLGGLIALRDAIYSPEMRELVKGVAGCADLSGEPECKIRIYNQGCHHLCSPDAFQAEGGVRFEFFIIDPEETWSESDGGALELYAPGASPEPEARVYPKFNSMCLWPSGSGPLTAIEEVFSDNTLMSITGIYRPAAPLATSAAEVVPTASVAPSDEPQFDKLGALDADAGGDVPQLSDADVLYLSEFIAEEYLKKDNIKKIQEKSDPGRAQSFVTVVECLYDA